MSTGFTRIAALAVPLLLAAACAGDNADNANGADANMPADTAMYAPPPAPPVMDTSMMDTTMHTDTTHADTTPTQ